MTTLRSEFVSTLKTVAPALATNDLIPLFSHFWFSENKIIAFNDQIAISAPSKGFNASKTPFKGAVPKTLLALLEASWAKQLDFSTGKNEVNIRAAKAEIKLPLLPFEDTTAVFQMPRLKADDKLPVNTETFLAAIESCMRSVDADTSVPDQLGITIIPMEDNLHLYSTNGMTLSRAIVPIDKECPIKKRVVLSKLFCEQMLSLCGKDKAVVLEIHNDYALLMNTNGVMLFGRLIEVDKPLNFTGVIDQYLTKGYEKRLTPIPNAFPNAIDRAAIISNTNLGPGITSFTVKEGGRQLLMVTKSERGEVEDSLKYEGSEDTQYKGDPKRIRAGIGAFDTMLITPKCFVFSKENMIYMVSSKHGE
jgi:DNA polymerase III sliding clamp (beta) subunit (PCNA family)